MIQGRGRGRGRGRPRAREKSWTMSYSFTRVLDFELMSRRELRQRLEDLCEPDEKSCRICGYTYTEDFCPRCGLAKGDEEEKEILQARQERENQTTLPNETWDDFYEDPEGSDRDELEDFFSYTSPKSPSLREALLKRLSTSGLSDQEIAIGCELIDYIDESGNYPISPTSFSVIKELKEKLEKALSKGAKVNDKLIETLSGRIINGSNLLVPLDDRVVILLAQIMRTPKAMSNHAEQIRPRLNENLDENYYPVIDDVYSMLYALKLKANREIKETLEGVINVLDSTDTASTNDEAFLWFVQQLANILNVSSGHHSVISEVLKEHLKQFEIHEYMDEIRHLLVAMGESLEVLRSEIAGHRITKEESIYNMVIAGFRSKSLDRTTEYLQNLLQCYRPLVTGQQEDIPANSIYLSSVLGVLDIVQSSSSDKHLIELLHQNVAKRCGADKQTIENLLSHFSSFLKEASFLRESSSPSTQPSSEIPLPSIIAQKADDGELEMSIPKDWIDFKIREVLNDPSRKREANLILEGCKQRVENLKQVAEVLKRFQKEFFYADTPEEAHSALTPLTQKKIAEKIVGEEDENQIQSKESTISRLFQNSYIQTPAGIFPLSLLAASTKSLIIPTVKEIISKEDKNQPLSDPKIAECLKRNTSLKETLKEFKDDSLRKQVRESRKELGYPKYSERKREAIKQKIFEIANGNLDSIDARELLKKIKDTGFTGKNYISKKLIREYCEEVKKRS